MYLNRCFDNSDMNKQIPMEGMMNPSTCPAIIECPEERVCHREICYDVPHIIPINTKIVNHHIYRHTYQPCYTYTTEDEVSNIYDNKCGF